MKKFSKFEISAIKRTAQIINPIVVKRDKALEKVRQLQKEIEEYDNTIAQYEKPILEMTGGYTTEELVVKNVEKGKPATYSLKYETVIPDYPDNPEAASVDTVEDVNFEEVCNEVSE